MEHLTVQTLQTWKEKDSRIQSSENKAKLKCNCKSSVTEKQTGGWSGPSHAAWGPQLRSWLLWAPAPVLGEPWHKLPGLLSCAWLSERSKLLHIPSPHLNTLTSILEEINFTDESESAHRDYHQRERESCPDRQPASQPDKQAMTILCRADCLPDWSPPGIELQGVWMM